MIGTDLRRTAVVVVATTIIVTVAGGIVTTMKKVGFMTRRKVKGRWGLGSWSVPCLRA